MSILQNSIRANLLSDVIHALEQEDHRLCILHGYKNYPEQIDSDVDAISDNPAKIPHILSQRKVANIVQVLQHEATAFYYILHREDKSKPAFIALDVSLDYRRNGRVFFRGEEFFQACRPFKFFQVPATELEFAYYIVKKIAKGELDEAQAQRLSELYSQEPEKCQEQLLRFFPEAEGKAIAAAAGSRHWQSVQNQMQKLRRAMLGKIRRENPVRVCQYWLGEFKRLVQRILQPTGLMVVFLGADGSGKSTVIERVEQDLAPAFRRTQYMHLRPRLGRAASENSTPVIDPHGQPPRSWITSTLKMFYFLFDYGVGYLWKIYPQLVRSTFVLFDRYYQDLLVDSKRYRYGGSMWLARLVGKLIPKPDLWILLDAPAEVLQRRKQEVPFAETARQQEAYLNLVSHFPNAVIVDSSKPLDEVLADVNKAILDFMARRTNKRLGL